MVEVFHDIEKNGRSEEERRFETAARMAACLAILSVVAVRIFQLRMILLDIGRECVKLLAWSGSGRPPESVRAKTRLRSGPRPSSLSRPGIPKERP